MEDFFIYDVSEMLCVCCCVKIDIYYDFPWLLQNIEKNKSITTRDRKSVV